ncbi:MAG: peptide chain release factor N(5)-glutamine methyltransferase [Saprospiraceae bacterium]|nr:peptide chain release factor N(5)-glutamine methyltransferase [Saprospiraceae bacterium]
MNYESAKKICVEKLTLDFGIIEAKSITRILFEDFFNYYTTEKDLDDFGVENQNHLFYFIEKVIQGFPIQYLTNSAYFWGRKFYVNSDVLIPRFETEELVEWIKLEVSKRNYIHSIIDIGTGSGCIPITLKLLFPNIEISALDISESALKIAAKNADTFKSEINFIHGDILSNIIFEKKFDIIVSNPPYIQEEEQVKMDKSVIDHEPKIALFVANNQPLIFYDSILNFAHNHLSDNGLIFVEINEFYANETVKLFEEKKYIATLKYDIQNKPRMIMAYKPN